MYFKKSSVAGTNQVGANPIVYVKENNNLNEIGDSKNRKERLYKVRK